MELFGLSIAEFLTALGSIIAVIITIKTAGNPSVSAESVDHLLGPINDELTKVKAAQRRRRRNSWIRRKREDLWRRNISRKLARIQKEIDKLVKNFEDGPPTGQDDFKDLDEEFSSNSPRKAEKPIDKERL